MAKRKDRYNMKKLPISISNLPEMINDNFIYVDKTAYIKQLIDGNKYCFLSRPRRFGKSLLVDTLYHLFLANEKLFKGLYIHPHWDWSISYPVLKFDLSKQTHKTPEGLNQYLLTQLKENQQRLGIECKYNNNVSFGFSELIQKAREKYQQRVVILIDEYDAPLLDLITQSEVGKEIRTNLQSFYSVIKGEDANLKFVLLTGVSKFTKVSIFSKLNNLVDIGMNPKFSALCGYTQNELESYFSDYLEGVDRQELKSWYNGYHWFGESVYNPFNILLFFNNEKEFLPYWFETGKTYFLVELLKKNHYHLPDLETKRFNFNDLNDFDLDRISFEILLFQAGYLTVAKEKSLWGEIEYRFSYPNKEVRKTLNYYFLKHYLTQKSQALQSSYKAFFNHDFELLEQCIRVLFDNIPCNNYTKNSIAHYEGYYASVMYAFLYSLNFDVIPEDTGNKGRIDISVLFTSPYTYKKQVYIFEFKVLESDKGNGSAMQQIKDKNYAAKYKNDSNQVFLVGIEFSRIQRNIIGFKWEEMA
jgi:hypothetical protein